MFLCKTAESENRNKNEAEYQRMSLPVNTCAVCWEGNGFYKCFQGDPARDECPCPEKRDGKNNKMQHQRDITVFFM